MLELLVKWVRRLTFDYAFLRKKNEMYVLLLHQISDEKKQFYPAIPVDTFKELCIYINKHFQAISLADLDKLKP